MSQTAETFVQSIVQQNWTAAYQNLSRVGYDELFRVLAFIDRSDLAQIACEKERAGAQALANNPDKLAEISFATQTVMKGHKPAPPKKPLQLKTLTPAALKAQPHFDATFLREADSYLHHVVMLKQMPIGISYDATLTVPVSSSNPAGLTDDDFRAAALNLNVEVAAIKAVTMVEAPKGGFQDGKRPTLRYELHIFHSRTGGRFHATHPWLSQPSRTGGNKYHAADDQDREYSMLYNAILMGGANRAIDQALVSASYGRFQTMGFNYDVAGGWPSVQSFVSSMFISEAQHLRAFIGFVRTNKLQAAIQKQDWAGFASRYNGPSYADNDYDTKMAKYYEALKAAEAKAAAVKPAAAAQPAMAH